MTRAVIPALVVNISMTFLPFPFFFHTVAGVWGLRWRRPVRASYKIPQLMATATPTFSFLGIWRLHTSFQGNKARLMSIAAE